ncbi:hypothetical protein MYX64_05355 [Nitrospinae bacterium AH_259_B05_G02_I21]|nr:hypothetical protein [Nitrospinae bacterium AH_259_B05_G02_I21]MDA2931711.1 hypothetical protein [Nitrospinae bacterium AH-259-F20]
MRCTATSKRTKKRCGAQAVTGSDKCRHHGGLTPRGPTSPNFIHGRYSKFPVAGLEERVEALKHDPELLSLDLRIAELQALRLHLTGAVVDLGSIDKDTRDTLHRYIVEEGKLIERRGKLEVQRGLVHIKFLELVISLFLEEVARELGDRDRAVELSRRVRDRLRLPRGHDLAVNDNADQ